mgnify:FL=1
MRERDWRATMRRYEPEVCIEKKRQNTVINFIMNIYKYVYV